MSEGEDDGQVSPVAMPFSSSDQLVNVSFLKPFGGRGLDFNPFDLIGIMLNTSLSSLARGERHLQTDSGNGDKFL